MEMKTVATNTIKFSSDKEFVLDGSAENFGQFVQLLKPGCSENEDGGCSDEEFDSPPELKTKELHGPFFTPPYPPASLTTITCSDGNIKANILLYKLRTYTKQFFSEWTGGDFGFPGSGRYFAENAGMFAKMKTSLDSGKKFAPGKYVFGLSQVEVVLGNDERLSIVDEELRDWIISLGLNVTRWDLPYRGYNQVIGIDNILEKIFSEVVSNAGPECVPVPHHQLGTIQLYCAFPKSHPIGGPYLDILKQGKLHKFLDFFNALIFGVEASRNYTVFFTGLLVLIYMRQGSSAKKSDDDICYDQLLDLFPMSVVGTGSGNMIMEKASHIATGLAEQNKELIQNVVGFKEFRKRPKWLIVTLRSVCLIFMEIMNCDWFGMDNTHTRKAFMEAFESEILYETYLHYYAKRMTDFF